MAFYKDYAKVLVAVDCIIFGFDEGKLKILIGRRKIDPGRGEWSLYGGFVAANEDVNDAANRVLYELTGLKTLYMRQVGAFGKVDRDPGERVVSVAYYVLINTKDYDDNLRRQYGLEWVSVNAIPMLFSDHNIMVQKALKLMKQKISTEPVAFRLLPPLFTLTQLQRLYETILDTELDKRNFRKRVKEFSYIEKTELIDKTSSKRGAYLYRFNQHHYQEEQTFKL
jgi:ADP-ribose pyrophosphatase YjhB (NUDIX family)